VSEHRSIVMAKRRVSDKAGWIAVIVIAICAVWMLVPKTGSRDTVGVKFQEYRRTGWSTPSVILVLSNGTAHPISPSCWIDPENKYPVFWDLSASERRPLAPNCQRTIAIPPVEPGPRRRFKICYTPLAVQNRFGRTISATPLRRFIPQSWTQSKQVEVTNVPPLADSSLW
jgi:hypothetical protein